MLGRNKREHSRSQKDAEENALRGDSEGDAFLHGEVFGSRECGKYGGYRINPVRNLIKIYKNLLAAPVPVKAIFEQKAVFNKTSQP